jgi:hypothetical protein
VLSVDTLQLKQPFVVVAGQCSASWPRRHLAPITCRPGAHCRLSSSTGERWSTKGSGEVGKGVCRVGKRVCRVGKGVLRIGKRVLRIGKRVCRVGKRVCRSHGAAGGTALAARPVARASSGSSQGWAFRRSTDPRSHRAGPLRGPQCRDGRSFLLPRLELGAAQAGARRAGARLCGSRVVVAASHRGAARPVRDVAGGGDELRRSHALRHRVEHRIGAGELDDAAEAWSTEQDS